MLTPLQTRIAELVVGLPQARGFALAGAGGLLVRGLIDRSTRDLDYFTVPGEEEAVRILRDALERALDSAGLDHRRQRDLSAFVRIEVSDGEDVCEVDLAVDYRALPTEQSRYGPTLAVEELAANKVLALFDRSEARDFLDLAELTHQFEIQRLFDLAAEKDTGFDKSLFLEALAAFDRFTSEDFGVNDDEYDQLRNRVLTWRAQLSRELRRDPRDQGLDSGR